MKQGRWVSSLLRLLPLIATITLVLLAMEPPSVVPASAPPTAFSAERAFAHVQRIAAEPHPPGTIAHQKVRDYLVAQLNQLGLETHLQVAPVLDPERGFVIAYAPENIIARLKGQGSGKAVLLAAHYDSHLTGPGAGDDAAGVAALLETVRALRQSGPLSRDVLVLITDGEEYGLLGARSFVESAPEAKEAGVVLNFEARGAGGPVFMFETSNNNAGLIGAFAQSAPQPRASSLMYALYKTLPNDTDLTVFKAAGLAGLNFACVGQWTRYHTAADTPENLDQRSLQHHGSYALALAQRLAGPDLEALTAPSQGNAIYFDLLGRLQLHYPLALGWPLALVTVALYGLALWRSRKETGVAKDFGRGVVGAIEGLTLGYVLDRFVLGWVVSGVRQGAPWRNPYGARWLEATVFLLCAAGALALLGRRPRTRAGVLGLLFPWLLALLAVSAFLTEGNYLFCWPLLAVLLALLIEKQSYAQKLLALLPLLVLFTPVWHGLSLLLGFGMPGILGLLAVFAFLPTLTTLTHDVCAPWPQVAALAAAGLACLVPGLLLRPGTPELPHIRTLAYLADQNGARWVSFAPPNAATRPQLGDNPTRVPQGQLFPWNPPQELWTNPTARQEPPTTPPQERVFWTAQPVRGATFGGKPVPLQKGGRLRLRVLAPRSSEKLSVDMPLGTVVNREEVFYERFSCPLGWMPAPVAPQTDIRLYHDTNAGDVH